mgnify:CR=1
MSCEIDITKIALSRDEVKKLRWISKHEPVQDHIIEENPILSRLYERDLIEPCCSEKFPHTELPEYVVGIPYNAFCLSDAGRQFLNRYREQNSDRRFTRALAIWGAITGTVSIIVEIWLHFL